MNVYKCNSIANYAETFKGHRVKHNYFCLVRSYFHGNYRNESDSDILKWQREASYRGGHSESIRNQMQSWQR